MTSFELLMEKVFGRQRVLFTTTKLVTFIKYWNSKMSEAENPANILIDEAWVTKF